MIFEYENFDMCATRADFSDFLELSYKIYRITDRQNLVAFQKLLKNAKSLHPIEGGGGMIHNKLRKDMAGTLLKKFWWIELYVTEDAIAKFYMT